MSVCVHVCSSKRVPKHVFWNFQVEVCLSHLRRGKTSADGQPLGSIAHCHHWITVQGEMRCLITSIPWFHLLNPKQGHWTLGCKQYFRILMRNYSSTRAESLGLSCTVYVFGPLPKICYIMFTCPRVYFCIWFGFYEFICLSVRVCVCITELWFLLTARLLYTIVHSQSNKHTDEAHSFPWTLFERTKAKAWMESDHYCSQLFILTKNRNLWLLTQAFNSPHMNDPNTIDVKPL